MESPRIPIGIVIAKFPPEEGLRMGMREEDKRHVAELEQLMADFMVLILAFKAEARARYREPAKVIVLSDYPKEETLSELT